MANNSPPIRQIEKAQINFNSVMQLSQDTIMSRINCHNIGKILSFNPDTQTADIQLMQIKRFNNEYITPTVLTDVPLIIYGAGGGHITLPDPTGSICLLLFMDRNIDAFLETGEMYTPTSTRMHDFTDCVALTTFKTLANPIQDYDTNAITMQFENSKLKVKDEISMDAKNDIHLKSVTKIVLDAPMVETTGNFSVATGYSGVIPCGAVSLQVTNGIITGVV